MYDMYDMYTGKCLKSEQFLKAEHLLKHAFSYCDRFYMVMIVKDV